MANMLHTGVGFNTVPPVVTRSTLSAQETLVAELVCAGLSNKQIAARAGLSEHTVSSYLRRIYSKLGVNSRVALVVTLHSFNA